MSSVHKSSVQTIFANHAEDCLHAGWVYLDLGTLLADEARLKLIK